MIGDDHSTARFRYVFYPVNFDAIEELHHQHPSHFDHRLWQSPKRVSKDGQRQQTEDQKNAAGRAQGKFARLLKNLFDFPLLWFGSACCRQPELFIVAGVDQLLHQRSRHQTRLDDEEGDGEV